jgi:hypothetical protein
MGATATSAAPEDERGWCCAGAAAEGAIAGALSRRGRAAPPSP